MPIVGFTDALGVNHTFADILAGAGEFRTRSGGLIPRPLVRMLANRYTPHDADYYGVDGDCVSVTTLVAPVQITRLQERHDIYVKPDDGLWAAYGTLMHLMLEDGADENSISEQRFTLPVGGGLFLGGTIDHIDPEESRGDDWKVTSAYKVKKMLKEGVLRAAPDYYWQAQLYARLAIYHGHDIRKWQLVTVCRDWTERTHGASIGAIEVVDIPLEPAAVVRGYLRERLTLYRASAMCDDDGLPACSDEETWQGRRCASYCAAAKFCHQLNPGLSQ